MDLIQILLQTSSEYWNNVIQNAIGGTIGSFIAIYVSIKIYWQTEKKSQVAATEATKFKEENQLKAFALMLRDATKMVKQQSEAVNKFIDELKKQPDEFPKINVYPLGNLKRIINNITIEGTGLTYMKYFPSENSAKEFTGMLELVDYFYYEFNGLGSLVQRATLNHLDRRIEVSKTLERINKYLIDYGGQTQSFGNAGQRIMEIRANFDTNRGSLDNTKSVNDLFFKPLNQLMIEFIRNGNKTSFTTDLAYDSSRGMEFFGYIGAGYLQFEKEMEGIKNEVNKNVEKLETVTTKILKSA